MEKIIFLDYDGVLNSLSTLKSNNDNRLFWGKFSKEYPNLRLKALLAYLDFEKIQLLKKIVTYTNAKIVTVSSWQITAYFPLIEEHLINLGLPMINTTFIWSRAEQIEDYLRNHNVSNFVILDDEKSFYYGEYDYLLNFLFKTNIFDGGLTEDIANDIIDFLKSDNNVSFKDLIIEHSRKRIKY